MSRGWRQVEQSVALTKGTAVEGPFSLSLSLCGFNLLLRKIIQLLFNQQPRWPGEAVTEPMGVVPVFNHENDLVVLSEEGREVTPWMAFCPHPEPTLISVGSQPAVQGHRLCVCVVLRGRTRGRTYSVVSSIGVQGVLT